MRIVKVLLCLVNVSYSHKYSWQAGWGELVSGARHLLILLFKVTTNQFCWPGLGTGPALGWGSQHIAQQQHQVLRGWGCVHPSLSLFMYKILTSQLWLKKMFVGGKKRFRHRELNPDLLGENQISWPLDYNGGYKYSLNMYQVLTGLNTEVTAAAASGCTWNKMELILLKNFIEVDSLFERIKRQTIDS